MLSIRLVQAALPQGSQSNRPGLGVEKVGEGISVPWAQINVSCKLNVPDAPLLETGV